MTEPLDLDALEKRLRSADGFVGTVSISAETISQLIAAARRLRELEGALGFLNRVRALGVSAKLRSSTDILRYATELGWDPKAKDGG